MQNNCISVKNFEDIRAIYSASKPVEIFMVSDTKDVIDRLFDTTIERFQQAIVTSQKNGSKFAHESVGLLFYYFMKIDIRRAESYIKSPDWIAHKGAKLNPKNIEDNKCFQYSITSGLYHNKMKKYMFSAYRRIKTG